MAQFELFHIVPQLRADISIPSYCALSDAEGCKGKAEEEEEEEEEVTINCWIVSESSEFKVGGGSNKRGRKGTKRNGDTLPF